MEITEWELWSSWAWPLHCISTAAMAGLIWLVQLAHYPLMLELGPERFPAWHRAHLRRVTWVVGPLMLIETATGVWWITRSELSSSPWLAWLGMALILIIWISTAVLQIPAHRRLELGGYQPDQITSLVRGNWVRTLAWTFRAILVASQV